MGIVRQISLIDEETGEFISSNQQKLGSKLKEGWIVVYKRALIKLLDDCPNCATLKVYLRIAAAQTYDTITYITTPYVAKSLGITYQTAWNAVRWLVNNGYLRKTSNPTGATGFIVNPLVSTCGKHNYDEKVDAFADADTSLEETSETLVEELPLADMPKPRVRSKGTKDNTVDKVLPGMTVSDVDEDELIPTISFDEFTAFASGAASIPASLLE